MATNCPLFEDAYYTYTIDLSSNTYNLTFRWSDRVQGWLMDVSNADEVVIVRGVHLVPMYPLLEQFALENPVGDFFLFPIEENSPSLSKPREIYKTHYLMYVDGAT